MRPISRGMWSGLLATAQMTQFLLWGFRRLPAGQRAPLPPAELTREACQKAGLPAPSEMGESVNHSLTAHFLFGLGCATLYSMIQSRREPSRPAMEGAGFGLAVWAGSYLAGIPALGFQPSAYRMSPARNILMITAHLVWGASLGAADQGFRGRAFDGRRSVKSLRRQKAAS